MADTNWIKLNRRIWDNFIWNFDKPQYALAWIDLLLMANYKDKQIMFDGKVETIQRGSFVTSMVKLSERWSMNRKTVKSFLDVLQNSGMITYTTTKRRTTVFITNYLIYQGFAGSEHETDGQLTGQVTGQPDGQLTGQVTGQPDGHNIRRLKKIKESKESKEDLTVSNDTVRSTDVQRIIQSWNALGLSQIKKIEPNTNRHALLKARIKSYGVDGVVKAIEKVRESNFLLGGGKNGWTITFDWLIKPNNFPKVLEGNYDGHAEKASGGGRKEMAPKWMTSVDNDDMKKYVQDLKKTTGSDPELAARAAALRDKIANGGSSNGDRETD